MDAMRPQTTTASPANAQASGAAPATANQNAPVAVVESRGIEGLHALARTWALLAGNASPFFQRHGWYKNYLTYLDPRPQTLRLFTVRKDGAPIAILPLRPGEFRLRGLPLRALELPSHPHAPLADIVGVSTSFDAAMADHFARALRHSGLAWDVLLFRGVTHSSAARAWAARWPRVLVAQSGHRDYLSCDRPYADLLASFSKNFRSSLRKARNKLRSTEGVEFQRANAGDALAHAFNSFLDVEAAGWKGERGTAIKNNPTVTAFYRDVMEDFGARGQCEINILSIQGKAVAGQFCLRAGPTLHVLKIGYDEAYAKLSPGNLLLEKLLEDCPERGIKEVDLVTDAAWHSAWNPQREPVFEIMIFNTTPRGRAAYWAVKAKRKLDSKRRS